MFDHSYYMNIAMDLAIKGIGTVSPNPLVGAVIVKDRKIVGEGFHQKAGEAHAEVNAVNSSAENLEGAILYTTLEPCCHTNKKTPPCTKLIIEKKFKTVVVANLDPNPSVAGKGIEALRRAGITVITDICKELGEEVNKIFFKNMRTGLPFIHIKQAMTLDGKTASHTGDSKWITSATARSEVHELRYQYDAIMVGSKTANLDNPDLTCRRNEKVVKNILQGVEDVD